MDRSLTAPGATGCQDGRLNPQKVPGPWPCVTCSCVGCLSSSRGESSELTLTLVSLPLPSLDAVRLMPIMYRNDLAQGPRCLPYSGVSRDPVQDGRDERGRGTRAREARSPQGQRVPALLAHPWNVRREPSSDGARPVLGRRRHVRFRLRLASFQRRVWGVPQPTTSPVLRGRWSLR